MTARAASMALLIAGSMVLGCPEDSVQTTNTDAGGVPDVPVAVDPGGTVCPSGYAGDDCAGCAEGYVDLGNGICLFSCSQAGDSCGPHAFCDESSGLPACVCDPGYGGEGCLDCAEGWQDNDDTGSCEPDCELAALECGEYGACEDAGGVAVCACAPTHAGAACATCADGLQDNDGDGSCLADCSALVCGDNGVCSDALGPAACVCQPNYTGAHCDGCADGWQDYDNDQLCDVSCAQVDCGTNGQCADASGEAICTCTDGYVGADCAGCAPGYQDNDGDGTCELSCAEAAVLCVQGLCVDVGGESVCVCNEGYQGALCDGCAEGWQDNDDDGVCRESCATAAPECGFGACDDAGGEATCVCDKGYTGSDCIACAVGYQDLDGDGTCESACALAGLDCGDNGVCDESTGSIECVCVDGYVGEVCDECAEGWQDLDEDGECLPTCAEGGLECGDHGSCKDDTGVASCSCSEGYAGALCDACAAGWQDNDEDGSCAPSCPTSGLECGVNGLCADWDGTATCVCSAGYAGDDCVGCAVGFQDKDDNGSCLFTCESSGLDCGAFGTCSHTTGEAACTCLQGHVGVECEACAGGWQDNDGDGSCQPGCVKAGVDCGEHGTCSDAAGLSSCICAEGYTGAACETCALGWQDEDGDGQCALGCTAANLDCGAHGACEDANGAAGCVCDVGYAGAGCDVCGPWWQDNDEDGTCAPACSGAGLSCENGLCTDVSGLALCACQPGYGGALCDVCADGFQDNDGDGTCLLSCDGGELECGANGACSDQAGAALCVCDEGFGGSTCQACALGFQDNDANGSCAPTCASLGLDCGAGTCTDASGAATCACSAGYAGAGCEACTAGYQDNDGDGSCLPDCGLAAPECGTKGACSDVGGTAACVCATGYAGVDCAVCAAGYQDADGDGICTSGCSGSPLDCGAHGLCSDASGSAACVCNPGYAGPLCAACAAGFQDLDNDNTCVATCAVSPLDCGAFGVCSDLSGTPTCECDTGYGGATCATCDASFQDNDGDGSCNPGCVLASLDCGAHGKCSDVSGTAGCLCETGYVGVECEGCADGFVASGGSCVAGCDTVGLDCGEHGTCDDASGSASCVCETGYAGATCDVCNGGYQDNDGDAICAPSCSGAGLDCGDHGTCVDGSGVPVCLCLPGHAGPTCAACADGFQDNDGNGSCLLSCDGLGTDCGAHGACSDAIGAAACVCQPGYGGAACELCAPGYQDADGDGTCAPDCVTSALSCGAKGTCVIQSGAATCICQLGYGGDGCDQCAPGFQDKDGDGVCLEGCGITSLDCGPNGGCADGTGAVACVCVTGYTGAVCDVCANGYQDNDSNGTCLESCTTSGLDCGLNGTCTDASGEAACDCDAGYTAALCDACAPNFQDNDGNGTCTTDCSTVDCGLHGACSASSGTALCVCYAGYTGAACDACALGFQDDDGDGTCNPKCLTTTLDCGDHGTCSSASGAVECVCDTGYVGALCNACDAGYQDNDGDGTCAQTCATSGIDCGAHGSCDDQGGLAECVCVTGYAGALCDECATGYQDNDGDGICAPICTTSALNCGPHGACEDSSGVAVCACDAGYVGTVCESCDTAAGYQDNDGDDVCLPNCATSGVNCGTHGSCTDASGAALCVCDLGYQGALCDACIDGYQLQGDGSCQANCFREDFSTPHAGWSLGTQWQFGEAAPTACGNSCTGQSSLSEDHTAANDDDQVAGVVLGGCGGTGQHSHYCLTSPAFDTSGHPTVKLRFFRNLHADYLNYMESKVEVYNGSSWHKLFTTPCCKCTNDPGWTQIDYDVTAQKNANMRVRWCYSVNQGGTYNSPSWMIDDVAFGAPECLFSAD